MGARSDVFCVVSVGRSSWRSDRFLRLSSSIDMSFVGTSSLRPSRSLRQTLFVENDFVGRSSLRLDRSLRLPSCVVKCFVGTSSLRLKMSLPSTSYFANDSVGEDVSSARRLASATSCVEMVIPSKTIPPKTSWCGRCCRDRSSPCPRCSLWFKMLVPASRL